MTFYTLLGFAKKSNKLVSGMTNCLYAIRKKKARLVIITEDAGINRKKVVRECQSQDIPFVEFGNRDEYLKFLGQNPACYWAVLSQEIAEGLIRELGKEKVQAKQYGGD